MPGTRMRLLPRSILKSPSDIDRPSFIITYQIVAQYHHSCEGGEEGSSWSITASKISSATGECILVGVRLVFGKTKVVALEK